MLYFFYFMLYCFVPYAKEFLSLLYDIVDGTTGTVAQAASGKHA